MMFDVTVDGSTKDKHPDNSLWPRTCFAAQNENKRRKESGGPPRTGPRYVKEIKRWREILPAAAS